MTLDTTATKIAIEIPAARNNIREIEKYTRDRIIGQHQLINRLLIALLADGHLLVEGAPGLAKTRAIKILGEAIEAAFHRIQFTPDLLPADLTGTEIYRPQDCSFRFQEGPLFHNLILADEINRAPAKVQSALLEAMEERQITCGHKTYALPALFLVMATQNPLEHEGTYPLPEAQLDRFLIHVNVFYPKPDEESKILALARREALACTDPGVQSLAQPQAQPLAQPLAQPRPKICEAEILAARREILAVHLSPALEEYLVQIVLATRNSSAYGEDLASWIEYGGSPRATIALDRCARAHAWLAGRDYVNPDDIQSLAPDVLRHRLILSYEAQANGITPDDVTQILIERIPVP